MKIQEKAQKILFVLLIFLILSSGFVTVSAKKQQCNFSANLDAINRTNWFWTEVDLVSELSDTNAFEPDIVVDNDGNIHIMWFDNTEYPDSGNDHDILYKFYDIETETWSPLEVVSTESSYASWYPRFVIDSKDNIHAVWKDLSNYDGCGGDDDIFYKRKDAETGNWTTTLVLSYFSTEISIGPSLCIDSNDNVHVVWYDFTNYLSSGTDGDIFYTVLDSETYQWSPIDVISTESTSNSFYPEIDSDSNGNIHVAWSDYTDYLGSGSDSDVFYKRWIRDLNYWTTTEVLSPHVLNIDSSTEVDLEIAEDGKVYVAWRDPSGFYGVGTDDDICLNTWDPIAGTWSGAAIVSMFSSGGSYAPSLCIDYSGVVHCVWMDSTDYNGAGTDWDLWFRSYDTVAETWTTPSVITDNNDYSATGIIVTDEKGFLYVVFADSSVMADSDTDQDIFLLRMVTLPESPIMSNILPNPSSNISINLEWNDVATAERYLVYRYKGEIQTAGDMLPYMISSENFFIDSINKSGTYYYGVVSINEFGESDLSNLVYVEVNIKRTISFFKSLAISDFAILAALVIGVQIIFTIILYFSLRGKISTKKKKKK